MKRDHNLTFICILNYNRRYFPLKPFSHDYLLTRPFLRAIAIEMDDATVSFHYSL